jgi:acyl-homoserine lactone acylase PvdQ
MDSLSPIDLEIARTIVRLARTGAVDAPELPAGLAEWDGRFTPDSKAASIEYAMRTAMQNQAPSMGALLLVLRDPARPPGALNALRDAFSPPTSRARPWGSVGAIAVEHPLSPLRFGFLNGAPLEGRGNEYTIHLQEPGFSQGFRAVWDTGNWDAGGIDIPNGESGEPGSGHYRDLAAAWRAGSLEALPFSTAAVARSTRATLILTP